VTGTKTLQVQSLELTDEIIAHPIAQQSLTEFRAVQQRMEKTALALAYSHPSKLIVRGNLVRFEEDAPKELTEIMDCMGANAWLHGQLRDVCQRDSQAKVAMRLASEGSLSETSEGVRGRTDQAQVPAPNSLPTPRIDLPSVITPSSPTTRVDRGSTSEPDESAAQEERRKRQRMALAAANRSGRSW
jgi:hypothetical protein